MSVKRNTKQRAVLLQILDTAEQHPSVSWIFAEARLVMPRISLGTVYRLLDILVNEGRIRRLVMDDGSSRYESLQHEHPHVICRVCGQVADGPSVDLATALDQLAVATGYQIASFQFNGYGLCPTCQRGESSEAQLRVEG